MHRKKILKYVSRLRKINAPAVQSRSSVVQSRSPVVGLRRRKLPDRADNTTDNSEHKTEAVRAKDIRDESVPTAESPRPQGGVFLMSDAAEPACVSCVHLFWLPWQLARALRRYSLVPVRAAGADLGRVRGAANSGEQVCGCGGDGRGLGCTRAVTCNAMVGAKETIKTGAGVCASTTTAHALLIFRHYTCVVRWVLDPYFRPAARPHGGIPNH